MCCSHVAFVYSCGCTEDVTFEYPCRRDRRHLDRSRRRRRRRRRRRHHRHHLQHPYRRNRRADHYAAMLPRKGPPAAIPSPPRDRAYEIADDRSWAVSPCSVPAAAAAAAAAKTALQEECHDCALLRCSLSSSSGTGNEGGGGGGEEGDEEEGGQNSQLTTGDRGGGRRARVPLGERQLNGLARLPDLGSDADLFEPVGD
ncbi:hypothetical protein F5X99DRAFT_424278 [Biscogniauxia marginata]|nr:hypothetical protein F5X99DRAFT_424278 [Biscogniauxia marginata]